MQNFLRGNTELRKAESNERWMIGRSIAINALGAMQGFEKLKYDNVPYFPEIELPERPRGEVDDEAVRAMSTKMDALINDRDREWDVLDDKYLNSLING